MASLTPSGTRTVTATVPAVTQVACPVLSLILAIARSDVLQSMPSDAVRIRDLSFSNIPTAVNATCPVGLSTLAF